MVVWSLEAMKERWRYLILPQNYDQNPIAIAQLGPLSQTVLASYLLFIDLINGSARNMLSPTPLYNPYSWGLSDEHLRTKIS